MGQKEPGSLADCISKTCMWQACMWQTCSEPTQQKFFCFFFFPFADVSGWGWRKGELRNCLIRHNRKAAFFGKNLEEKDENERVGSSKKTIGASRSVHCCLCLGVSVHFLPASLSYSWWLWDVFESLCTLYTCVVDRFYAWFQLNTQQACSSFSIQGCYPSFCYFVFVFVMSWPFNRPSRVAKSSGTAPSAPFYSQRDLRICQQMYLET